MKYEGHINLGCNHSGKGDKDRSLYGDGKKQYRNTFDNIFKGDSMKLCSGCNKTKNWKYHIMNKEGNYYFCEDCREAYLKLKKGK